MNNSIPILLLAIIALAFFISDHIKTAREEKNTSLLITILMLYLISCLSLWSTGSLLQRVQLLETGQVIQENSLTTAEVSEVAVRFEIFHRCAEAMSTASLMDQDQTRFCWLLMNDQLKEDQLQREEIRMKLKKDAAAHRFYRMEEE